LVKVGNKFNSERNSICTVLLLFSNCAVSRIFENKDYLALEASEIDWVKKSSTLCEIFRFDREIGSKEQVRQFLCAIPQNDTSLLGKPPVIYYAARERIASK